MRRVLLLAVLALAAFGAGGARADNPQLVGTVGTNDGFTISLAFNGSPATHLDPGTYTLLVHDRSQIHNFHFSGPGVDVATDVGGTGDKTFTVTLTDGTYAFICDVHAAEMHGAVAVGTAQLPSSGGGGTTTPARKKLSGSVGPGKKILLGHPSKAGAYAITIADRSKTDDFHLSGPGVSKKTGVKTTGTVTWKVTLRKGTYTYRSDAHPTLRGSFTISG